MYIIMTLITNRQKQSFYQGPWFIMTDREKRDLQNGIRDPISSGGSNSIDTRGS